MQNESKFSINVELNADSSQREDIISLRANFE